MKVCLSSDEVYQKITDEDVVKSLPGSFNVTYRSNVKKTVDTNVPEEKKSEWNIPDGVCKV